MRKNFYKIYLDFFFRDEEIFNKLIKKFSRKNFLKFWKEFLFGSIRVKLLNLTNNHYPYYEKFFLLYFVNLKTFYANINYLWNRNNK